MQLLIKNQVEDEVWLLGFSQMISIWIYITIEQLLQKKFVNFCQYSDIQLPKNKVNKIDDIIITLDNASWHTSEETKLHTKRLGFNVIYLHHTHPCSFENISGVSGVKVSKSLKEKF